MAERSHPGLTPSQTVGPFFAYVLTPKDYGYPELAGNDLVTPDVAGERIRIEGRIVDGDGEPVPDAMVEIWQPDGNGRFADRTSNSAYRGFGRVHVDGTGAFAFSTVKPGPVEGPGGASQDTRVQAPHVNVGIFARGILKRLFTRIYFEGEAANAEDPILRLVPAERRGTLVAARSERDGEALYTLTIRLQGENETVFFAA